MGGPFRPPLCKICSCEVIHMKYMLYTQLFKPNRMEILSWSSTSCRRPWWTIWRTSRWGSAGTIFYLNTRVWHMLYTQLFKPNRMETLPRPSNPCRRPWWTMWKTSRRGSARKTFWFEYKSVAHVIYPTFQAQSNGNPPMTINPK